MWRWRLPFAGECAAECAGLCPPAGYAGSAYAYAPCPFPFPFPWTLPSPPPYEFDPWRFAKVHEEEGENARSQMTFVSTEYLPFGLGRHAW